DCQSGPQPCESIWSTRPLANGFAQRAWPRQPMNQRRDDMYAMPGSVILPYRGTRPKLGHGVVLASGAHLIGDLIVGDEASFWFNTVVRADCNYIRIGQRTNVQDGTVIHVTNGDAPTEIGDDVTIGHNATIHGCTIKSGSLIGMGAVILDH